MNKVVTLETWEESFPQERYAATIGNFDGVHLGHQDLLGKFLEECERLSLSPVLFTLKPHPELYFHPEKPHLLTDYARKYELLAQLGFQTIVEIDFQRLHGLTGKEFAQKHLLSRAGLELLWIGYDFSFGADRADPEQCLPEAVKVEKRDPFTIDGEIVSSSLIRSLLSQGDIKKANKLLGRPFKVSGVVVHGKKLGRKLGFPTINLDIPKESYPPRYGVYAVSCHWEGQRVKGALNVGVNPTVDTDNLCKWEVNLLDFNGDLYGKKVSVEFHDFIRGEKKFDDVDKLREQIGLDVEKARQML